MYLHLQYEYVYVYFLVAGMVLSEKGKKLFENYKKDAFSLKVLGSNCSLHCVTIQIKKLLKLKLQFFFGIFSAQCM